MRFHTLEIALLAQRAIVPLVQRIQRHDRKLAQQMKDATNSFVLNLGEGAYWRGGCSSRLSRTRSPCPEPTALWSGGACKELGAEPRPAVTRPWSRHPNRLLTA